MFRIGRDRWTLSAFMTTDTIVKTRRHSRVVRLGSVAVGGDAPISIQSMTKTDTRDVEATIAQIRELTAIGCDIVRLAVPDEVAARALAEIRSGSSLPLVADIHFDYRLALLALDAGVEGLRINPGNIGDKNRVKEVVRAAAARNVPIRIGVNAGSLEKEVLAEHGAATAAALVDSAMRHARILEDLDFHDIKISVKASDVARTVEAYRCLAGQTDYPLHLGLTEAGTLLPGSVRSGVAMGILLAEGIGDTIRVSLAEPPAQEVRAGLALLRCLGLRAPGPMVIACPTCGRAEINAAALAHRVESALEELALEYTEAAWPTVAVMGCMVNGPGEARDADIAVAGGKGCAALFVGGRHLVTAPEEQILDRLLEQTRKYLDQSSK